MKASSLVYSYLRSHEGLVLTAYNNRGIDNTWTIGYGHAVKVRQGMKITKAQAEAYLRQDIATAEAFINRTFRGLNQNQFDALCMFFFNLGPTEAKKDTICKLIKRNPKDPAIRQAFMMYNKANGKPIPALTKRRRYESNLYFQGIEATPSKIEETPVVKEAPPQEIKEEEPEEEVEEVAKGFIRAYISPSKGNNVFFSWKDKINEQTSPLMGYSKDLQKRSINAILKEILNSDIDGFPPSYNYLLVRDIYKNYIQQKKKLDIKEEEDKDIESLNSDSATDEAVKTILKYGIIPNVYLYIPLAKSDITSILIEKMSADIDTDVESLYNKYYNKVIYDKLYIPKYVRFSNININVSAKVYIYSKANSKLYDVTNFITNLYTSVSRGSGGNFSIELDAINLKNLESGNPYQEINTNISGFRDALRLQSIFRENDLVFIKFEPLEIEYKNSYIETLSSFESNPQEKLIYGKNKNKLFLTKENVEREQNLINQKMGEKKIKGKLWDMIGLIDSTSIDSSPTDLKINIQGRDLIKLLIEDTNFFIPIQFANTKNAIIGGKTGKIFNRLFSTGQYNLSFVSMLRSLRNSMGFIISQLSNMQIISDECFQFLKKEYGNTLSKELVLEEKTQTIQESSKKIIKGVWSLVNCVVDNTVGHYRLADASLKSPDGTIVEQIDKLCQSPFVEFLADTFGDKYNLIIRRPPWAIEDILKQTFICVNLKDCYSDNLTICREAYSVYQLNPQGGFFVSDSSLALSYLPLIVLEDYAKLWGNKLLSITYNYTNIDSYLGDSKENKSIKKTFIDDLIWLIKVNSYLPFSRTGTISIIGDRRIKVGQWIYYAKTNEVFYVDGVANNMQINSNGQITRFTTLNVSRGLVLNCLKHEDKGSGVTKYKLGNSAKTSTKDITMEVQRSYSYNDIINVEYLRNALNSFIENLNKTTKSNKTTEAGKTEKEKAPLVSIVNKFIFDYFLSGAQFDFAESNYYYYEKISSLKIDEIEYEEAKIFEESTSDSTNVIEQKKIKIKQAN